MKNSVNDKIFNYMFNALWKIAERTSNAPFPLSSPVKGAVSNPMH